MTRQIHRLLIYICCALSAAISSPAYADPADIDAAARGVVRVVVVGRDGEQVFAISHGSGFAVNSETIVTNAHVVRNAMEDDRLSIGIVPSNGGEAVFGRLLSISPRNDLALISTTSPMRLPPLTIAGNPPTSSGTVTAVGYPMNVDQAQGLNAEDIFRTQPPVTSQGFLSGSRPSREFDTLLHTAPIARGNSGGPLVDVCGRVVGVNSFGAESEGTEAEFFFAVTMRELLPFLRANEITPQINSLPCRSLADLEDDERAREERIQEAAQLEAEANEQAQARLREEARRDIEFAILDERANGLALAFVMLLIALGGCAFAFDAHRRGDHRPRAIGGSIALAALVIALVAWLNRPAFAEVEERLEEHLRAEMVDVANADSGIIEAATQSGELACVLDQSRSRVLGTPVTDMELDWADEGCVNGRTQYGRADGRWTRIFVPASEEAVTINRYDPETGEYVVDRYLPDSSIMASARTARGQYEAPICGEGSDASLRLGAQQTAVLSLLPDNPNERLVYSCGPRGDDLNTAKAPDG